MTGSSASDARELLSDLLATFRDAREPSAPAERLWTEAAPRFRSRLGGPEHLAHLFGNPAWAPLMGHASAEIEAWDELDGAARATVRVVASDGAVVRYVASLSRPRGGGDGSQSSESDWRISGLVRAELADA